MRITREMLECYASELNLIYGLSLSVEYFNGCTHLYESQHSISAGTTPECYHALQVFMNGFYTCMELKANKNEVK